MIPDTGSHITAVPCSKCTGCGHNHINPFQSTESPSFKWVACHSGCSCGSSYQPNSCEFYIGYAEGSSYSGVYFRERVVLGDALYRGADPARVAAEAVEAEIGCIAKETNLFYSQEANGILGLDRRMTSDLLQRTYELHTNYTQEKLGFSICYGYNGGMMTIGGVNHSHTTDPVPIVLKLDHDNMYASQLDSIFIGTQKVSVSDRALFDSGTTFAYLKDSLFKAVVGELDAFCTQQQGCTPVTKGIDKCYQYA